MMSLFQTAAGSWHVPSILMASSWLLGTILTGIFMVANLRVNRDDRLKAFRKEHDSAAKASEMESSLRDTATKLTVAEKSARDARALAEQLDNKQRPRIIAPEQIPLFITALANVPRGKVRIVRKCQSAECTGFSTQLQDLMRKAGFAVDDEIVDMIVMGPTPVGLFVGVANTERYPVHGGQIQTALATIGLAAEGTKFGTEEDVVSVIVGTKP